MKRFVLLLLLFVCLLACSEPVSSNDLEAARVDFVVIVEPDWGDVYKVNATLRPDGDDHDYVLLNLKDSIYVRVKDQRAKLVLDDSDYNGQIEAKSGDTLEVVVYMNHAGDHMVSSVVIPQRIAHESDRPLDVSARYVATSYWIPSGGDEETRAAWKLKCAGENLSRSTEYKETYPDSHGKSLWDFGDFIGEYEWGKGFGCEIWNKLERVKQGTIDYAFRGGKILAFEYSEQNLTFP